MMVVFFVFAGLILALVAGITLTRWRTGVAFLFCWLLLEGTLRRLAPVQLHLPIFLFKDVIVGLVLIGFLISRGRSGSKILPGPGSRWVLLFVPAALFFGLAVVQSVSPRLPSYFIGLFGLKAHFFYLPLVVVAYHFFRTGEEVRRAALFVALTLVPILGVAVYQIFNPNLDAVSAFYSARIRSTQAENMLLPTSIFVGEVRFASYALLALLLSLGALGWEYRVDERRSISPKLVAWLGVLCAAAAVFASAKNLAILLALVLTPVMVWLVNILAQGSPASSVRRGFPVTGLIGVLTACGVGLFVAMPARMTLLVQFMILRLSSQHIQNEGALGVWREIEGMLGEGRRGVLGTGIGTHTQGVDYLSAAISYESDAYFRFQEGILPKLVIEMGIMGGLIGFAFIMAVAVLALLALRDIRAAAGFPFGAGLGLYVLAWTVYAWKSHSFYNDPFQQIYLWLSLGVLLSLAYRPELRRWSAAAPSINPQPDTL